MSTKNVSTAKQLFAGWLTPSGALSNEAQLAKLIAENPPPHLWIDAATRLRVSGMRPSSMRFKSTDRNVVAKQRSHISSLLTREHLPDKLKLVAAAMMEEALEEPPKFVPARS